jgi:hypothetical protein
MHVECPTTRAQGQCTQRVGRRSERRALMQPHDQNGSLRRHRAALDSLGVTVEKATLIPTCEECGNPWFPDDDKRWRAYWIDDGNEDLLVFYCVDCAKREFGEH